MQAVIDTRPAGGRAAHHHRPGLLLRELRRIRELGIAYESEESGHGVGCAASPILGPDGKPVAAMSISGWNGKLDLRRVGPAVKTAALALSRDLRRCRGPGRPAPSLLAQCDPVVPMSDHSAQPTRHDRAAEHLVAVSAARRAASSTGSARNSGVLTSTQ